MTQAVGPRPRPAAPLVVRMMLIALLAVPAGPAAAAADVQACQGRDLIAAMTAPERAALDAVVSAVPYAQGNHWRATRGGQTIDLIGTFHIYDARMEQPLARLKPLIAAADRVYLEATDKEIAQLRQAVAARPELIVLQGKTLAERLPEADWKQLAAAMQARGIPPFMAAKFQPWYVSMLLGVPPCAMSVLSQGATGMDRLISETARADNVPMAALEPYDAVLRAISALSEADQATMIRDALRTENQSEDMLATLTATYFREDHRAIWEFARQAALKAPGADPARIDADLARLDQALVTSRNQAWVALLEKASGANLVVAFGAGHLAGDKGVLNLLAQAGYSLTRQPF